MKRFRLEEGIPWDRVVPVLRAGGIAVMPCDTIYGLVGVAPEAEGRLRELKGRGEEKPFIQLLPSISFLPSLTELALPTELEPYWPGPLTLIFPARGSGTIAVRLPADPLLQKLLRALNKPLFSTSVNRGGQPPLCRIRDIVEAFGPEVDLILDAGDLPQRSPSAIIDVCARPFRLVRRGLLSLPANLFE